MLTVAAGMPDLSYGEDGLVEISLPNGSLNSSATDIVIGDNDVVYGIAERSRFDTEQVDHVIFARDSSGDPLTSFSEDGFVTAESLGFDFRVESIALAPDGKLVIGGSSGSAFRVPSDPDFFEGDFAFMRLDPEGTLDRGFGSGGLTVVDRGNDFDLNDIVVLPSGQILAIGTSMFTQFSLAPGPEVPVNHDYVDYGALIKLDANGDLDTNFGDIVKSGVNLFGYETRPRELTIHTTVNHSMRIQVASEQDVVGHGRQDIVVDQFFANGEQDLGFGGTGVGTPGEDKGTEEVIGVFHRDEYVESMTISGRWLYISGYWIDPVTSDSADFVARVPVGPGELPQGVSDAGVWDKTFGDSGFLIVDSVSPKLLDAPDGFYVAGSQTDFSDVDFITSMAVSYYTHDGLLNPGFGVNGTGSIRTSDFPTGGTRLTRDQSGHLLFGREIFSTESFDYALNVARFIESETSVVTVSFESSSLAVTELGNHLTLSISLSQSFDESVEVPIDLGGTATVDDDYVIESAMIRFEPNQTETQWSIDIRDDQLDETTEVINLQLVGTSLVSLGEASLLRISILDDDGDRPDGFVSLHAENLLSNVHVPGNDQTHAIFFHVSADTELGVVAVDGQPLQEAVTLVDANQNPIGQYSEFGLARSSLIAGETYGLIFQPRVAPSEFQIQSSSGIASIANPGRRNLLLPSDVNGDGRASAIDALRVINLLSGTDENRISTVSVPSHQTGYFDVSGDNQISALDALQVVNFLARESTAWSDGESVVTPSGHTAQRGDWSRNREIDLAWNDLAQIDSTSPTGKILSDLTVTDHSQLVAVTLANVDQPWETDGVDRALRDLTEDWIWG